MHKVGRPMSASGLGRVKTRCLTPGSSQLPPLRLGPFVLPVLAISGSRRGPGSQSQRLRVTVTVEIVSASTIYVRIAAISRLGPMMFTTRVRL
jgi:hypothetical protein